MHTALRKRLSFYLTCACAGIIILILSANKTASTAVFNCNFDSTAVIDPGHGGYDCGALGADGTKECELNLDISIRLRDILSLYGLRTVMTRTDDTPLTDMESYSEHQELVRRTEIANTEQNAVLISVHQNTFPNAVPSGLQVLYAENTDSKQLGNLIQSNITALLDTENRRVAQPAPKKLYITANAKCPAVLIECGFISNSSDLEKLKSTDYQKSFAMLTAASYLQYLSGSFY